MLLKGFFNRNFFLCYTENNKVSSGGTPDPKSKSKIPVMANDSKKKTTPNKLIKGLQYQIAL